ncbi:MAG: SAM-dependent methyltransferase [Mycolicibacterium insubricum]|nr:SAM-dependent methyltransferase [Mycobacterium sp.]
MARTADDNWDVAGKVGSTALATAVVRAAESLREDRLFADPFAQRFIDAAVAAGWRNPHGTDAWHANDYEDPAVAQFREVSTNGAACRTRFIDDFLGTGAERQVVLLAAGLDARAWRLPWPAGVTVYELDQPGVLAFKADVMAGEEPGAGLRAVPVDLRHDWPHALVAAGFDATAPTVWVAEGLMPYLPPDGQDQLFERIDTYSAAGSRLVADVYPPEFYEPEKTRAMFAQMNATARADVYSGEELFFPAGQRAEADEWLSERGWTTSTETATEVMTALGRRPPAGVPVGTTNFRYLTAQCG